MIDEEKQEPEDDDEPLVCELRSRLRASSDSPDAVVRARLAAARARVIASRARPPAWSWAAAGAAVAACVVAAVIALRPDGGLAPQRPAGGDDVVAQSDMLELLTEDDGDGDDGDDGDDDPVMEAELYEDLDVLTWLAGEDESA